MKQLEEAVRSGVFLLQCQADDMPSVLRQTIGFLIERGLLEADQREAVIGALLARESEMSTAIGHAVAVPHAYLDGLIQPQVIFVQLAHPLNLGAPDGVPTRFLFVLLGPTGSAAEHLDALTNIARLMSDDGFRYEARQVRTQQELLSALEQFRARTAVSAMIPEAAVSEGLRYTGRLFGGVRADIRRRLPHYAADFRAGLNPKCMAATLFLFFACLAPTVTFGGVMAQMTGNQIGVVEMITAASFCGVVFALLGGQPLVILGGTGPLLIFTAILYQLCDTQGIPFLPTYAWIGLWTALLLLILAATDASCLMRFFTRFTDEIFAALIAFIFIYESVKALVNIFRGLDVRRHHDTALLSLILALGTFYIAINLLRFRRSRYLFSGMREFLADFGPTIAIAAMTLVAVFLREVDISVLPIPDHFQTSSGRPWRVDLLVVPMRIRLAAIIPAVLAVVLIFLNQNIVARLVNNADNKLVKGEAYHLDLGAVGLLIGVCSLFGLPWQVAATVRSLNHLRSLATTEEVVAPHGETRERIIHVLENRISPLAIHLLIGGSLLLLSYLKLIPMAVLYGLFLFMGVVSLVGNQFFERMTLWLTDSNLYPAMHYIRRVPRGAIHKFTLLQFVCLVVLWIVKGSRLGILFPLFIALLVPIRLLAGRYFAAEHLEILDAAEEPAEEATEWA